MSQFIKFYFTSSMLNMFRTLIHPSTGASDFSIVSPHWLCVLVSMCVGVSVWLVGVVSVWQASACNTDVTCYFISLLICSTRFRQLMCPSSGACDYSVELPHWSYCSCFDVFRRFGMVGLEWYPCCRLQPATRIPPQTATPKLQHTSKQEHTTNVVIQ